LSLKGRLLPTKRLSWVVALGQPGPSLWFMQYKESTIKYFMYCRKSSEGEERQVQSIDDQQERLVELAERMNIKVVKVFKEAKSAKAPGKRIVFEEMLERIEKGEANGILCWKIDRLSRNPVDSGKIQWLLQKNILECIQSYDRRYLPSDNALILSVESGVANQYIIDLRKNSMRGTERKLKLGWRPGVAPLGYLNTKNYEGLGVIISDPERYDLVRKMWDLMLTGTYSVPQVLEVANDEWGFRTRKTRKLGGKKLGQSGLYRIFTNDFYTGDFTYSGKEWHGEHEPMISLDEFDRVQRILGRKGKPRPKTHSFAFTGFIRCGECDCAITAEKKTKYIKSTGKTKSYTYYRCTRRKQDVNCSQRSCLREEKLEEQMDTALSQITILPEFRDWALDVLGKEHTKEVSNRTKIFETQQKSYNAAQNRLDKLTDMRLGDLLTDDEYVQKRDVIKKEIKKLKQNLDHTETRAEEWLKLTEQTFDFATYARIHFQNGDLQTKKQIMMALGSNSTIKEGKLSIEPNPWFIPIKNAYPALEKRYLALEPTENTMDKRKTKAIDDLRVSWLQGWDSNPRPIG
jgi:site-specific DNA recombinase